MSEDQDQMAEQGEKAGAVAVTHAGDGIWMSG